MFNGYFLKIFYKDAIALFCAASLSVSSPTQIKITAPLQLTSHLQLTQLKVDSTASVDTKTELWRYLRKGINYLEASGKELRPYYMHAGSKAYGPLALTPIAIKDVKKHRPDLSGFGIEEVLIDKELYEVFALAYADLLLKHYLKLDYFRMDKKEVFSILEKAWFLGPTLYKNGHPVIASREANAARYISSVS